MKNISRQTLGNVFALVGIVALLSFLPLLTHAQSSQAAAAASAQTSASSSAQLRTAIQNAVLKDPSSANVPPAKLDALIDALTAQAQKQGITPQQITYRPDQPVAGPAIATHSTCGTAFCSVANAFGFSGPTASVIFILLLISGALIIVIGFVILRHYRHHL